MKTKILIPQTRILQLISLLLFVLLNNVTLAQDGVGVNTTTPKSNFEVNGSFGQKVTGITATTTLDATYNTVVCNNGESAITINLPTIASSTGRFYVIKKGNSSTADITLDANGSETIEGASTLVLSDTKGAVTIFNDGTEWKTSYRTATSAAWGINGNTGTDSASNFIGTTDAQGMAIKTNNIERVHISKAGTTTVGGTTDHTKFEADGTMVMEGAATVWDDITVFPDATTKGSSAPPTYSIFKNNSSQGVFLNWFSATTENEVYFSVQLPHKYKVGTTLYPHVHWTTLSTAPSGTDVVWGLEYTVVSVGGTYNNTTILKANSVIGAIGTPSGYGQHLITDLGTINGTGLGISSIILCRLFRAATDGADTYANTTGLLSIDFHFEIDTEGSRTQYTK
jgi:hypothetical protein